MKPTVVSMPFRVNAYLTLSLDWMFLIKTTQILCSITLWKIKRMLLNKQSKLKMV